MLRDVPLGVWLLSIGDFFVFFGFDPAQNLVSRNFPDYGDISISVLYMMFAVSSIFTPYVLQRLSPHLLALLAPLGYTLFTLATVSPSPVLFIFGGMSCGCTSAGLWVAAGCLIALESTESDRGRNNGILFAFTKLGAIGGNLLAGVIMEIASVTAVFLACFIAITISHIPIYVYFRKRRKVEQVKISLTAQSELGGGKEVQGNSKILSPIAMVLVVAKTCVQPERGYVYLLPLSIYIGLGKGWIVAMLPPRIEPPSAVGYTRAVFAFTYSVSGVLWGKLYDFFAKEVAIPRGIVYLILSISVTIIIGELLPMAFSESNRLPWFYLVNILIAIAAGGAETILSAMLASFPNQEQATVFSCHFMVQSLGWVVIFVCVSGIGLSASLPLALVTVTFAAIGMVTISLWSGPIGSKEIEKPTLETAA